MTTKQNDKKPKDKIKKVELDESDYVLFKSQDISGKFFQKLVENYSDDKHLKENIKELQIPESADIMFIFHYDKRSDEKMLLVEPLSFMQEVIFGDKKSKELPIKLSRESTEIQVDKCYSLKIHKSKKGSKKIKAYSLDNTCNLIRKIQKWIDKTEKLGIENKEEKISILQVYEIYLNYLKTKWTKIFKIKDLDKSDFKSSFLGVLPETRRYGNIDETSEWYTKLFNDPKGETNRRNEGSSSNSSSSDEKGAESASDSDNQNEKKKKTMRKPTTPKKKETSERIPVTKRKNNDTENGTKKFHGETNSPTKKTNDSSSSKKTAIGNIVDIHLGELMSFDVGQERKTKISKFYENMLPMYSEKIDEHVDKLELERNRDKILNLLAFKILVEKDKNAQEAINYMSKSNLN